MFRAKRSSRRISSTHELGEDTVECTTWIDRLRGRRRFKRRARHYPPSIPEQMQWPPLLPEARGPASLKSDPLLRLLLVAFLVLLIAAVAIFLIHQYVELQGSLQGMNTSQGHILSFSVSTMMVQWWNGVMVPPPPNGKRPLTISPLPHGLSWPK